MFVSFPTREKGVCFKGLLFCTVFFTSLLKNLKLDPIQWVEILKQQGYPSDTAGKVSRSSLKMEVAHKTLLPFLVFFFPKRKCTESPLEGTAQGCTAQSAAAASILDVLGLAGGAKPLPLLAGCRLNPISRSETTCSWRKRRDQLGNFS